ncbi:alpha-D-xyloside xylohydrolase [Chitinophaga dinghuensis]|uniref:Alpha-D-xyloside xylohydrolase n=1 Tax=Chitinophaga dinghuensis TaxID=1539050 RepID=A0A327VYE3_9BACT|nr:TIM-barrel domain-containing protein [Chitinophaga dinghuensis]RAJ82071.1 alpha-D-xyloside xylohydrolase [Chitinophaga dinghuensis]
MIKRTLPIVLLTCFTSWCRAGEVEKLSDGLLIKLDKNASHGTSRLRLQVVNEKIIHVTASPDETISSTPSLMAVETKSPATPWEYSEDKDTYILSTKSLQVAVNKTTGQIIYRYPSGKIIVSENPDGGRKFSPVNINGKQLYGIQQIFQVNPRAALYGLGQHQTGLMNYYGEDVDLTQYNSIAAIPFLLSTDKYGILWDNYSITKFGDPSTRKPLNALHLESKDGHSGGLSATYANKTNGKVLLKQIDSTINYEFLEDLDKLPKSFPLAQGKITWEGKLSGDQNGDYKFFVQSSGYLKIWMNGKLVLDKWRESWNPGPSQFKLPMQKGIAVPVRIEWIPETTQSFLSINLLSPTPAAYDGKAVFTSEAGEKLDYYFMGGSTMDEVISGYRQITGKATMPPQWALGFWQSRERYKTQAEIEQTVADFRKKKIPLDNIVLDWSYWKENAWGSQEFDLSRFPDAAGMIQRLHQDYHTQFMISVWPKFYEGIPNYQLFDQQHWLYKQNILNQQRDWIGKGYISTFYDAFNPNARQLFWQLLNEKLFSKGVDAWWLDATEPDILSNATIAARKKLMDPTAIGPAAQYFNTYSLENARGVYEGQRSVKPDQRVFILTRSAYAGIQRYGAASWSGDIAATFEEMARQIPAGLNYSMSGLPYWTTDIGGFFVEDKYDRPNPVGPALQEWRELNTRWFQYGAFCPLFRSHGQYPYREMFNIAPEGSEAFNTMLYYDQLRYRLLPYIYSLAGNVYHQDYTIMRGLPMDFGYDSAVYKIRDQFMFGDALLVNPVTVNKARSRELYLPKGDGWYDFYTGKYLSSGQHITATAPLSRMPLYVKAGSILPVGPVLQYTAERKPDTLNIYVYTGKDASFELYEDENINYGYERGAYSRIRFTWNEAGKTLQIGAREGSFPGMLEQRYFRIIFVDRQHPAAPDQPSGNELTTYNGIEKTIRAI